jgi:Skp family chaperone for outer membrane proteins
LDAVLTAVVQSLPQTGVAGVLLFVAVLLLRREASTEDRHAAELKRINEAHDAELAEMRADIKELREAQDKLNRVLDEERKLRRQIEDELAAARRGGTTT